MSETASATKGLEGVVIAQSQKSKVDGLIGKLQYHGYNIMDLAENAIFAEVIYLLWNNKLPTQSELEAFQKELYADRDLPSEIVAIMKQLPSEAHPMGVLRTTVSALGAMDLTAEDTSPEANAKKLRRLTAVMPTLVAAWERVRKGKDPIAPRADLGIAANFLYMMTGEEPRATAVDAIDSFLILLADHGMNASTFSSRVTTGTLADVYSAVTTAIGTLKGPAHGGANQKAMEQFQSIGKPADVQGWFDKTMAAGERIMGIGHRVYKAEDPRATILRQRSKALAEEVGGEIADWFEVAYQLEQLARGHEFFQERNLFANVDYYSAIVLYQAGIPVDQFTALFAMSRIAGWSAHIMEQWADNRLIRPRAEYIGPEDLAWVPIDKRS